MTVHLRITAGATLYTWGELTGDILVMALGVLVFCPAAALWALRYLKDARY